MPGMNGQGPLGKGPGTGFGLGTCGGAKTPEASPPAGQERCGRGRGRGMGGGGRCGAGLGRRTRAGQVDLSETRGSSDLVRTDES